MAQSEKTTSKPTVAKAKAPATEHQPRNFLAAFLLTTVCAPLGLRHFYLGDARLGWVRSGLFVGGMIWMLVFAGLGVAALSVVGWLAVVVASIWGVVDFFYVYLNVRHDAAGKSMVATPLDRTFATVIFWVTVGISVLCLILFIIGISIGQNAYTNWDNGLQPRNDTPSTNLTPNYDQSFYR